MERRRYRIGSDRAHRLHRPQRLSCIGRGPVMIKEVTLSSYFYHVRFYIFVFPRLACAIIRIIEVPGLFELDLFEQIWLPLSDSLDVFIILEIRRSFNLLEEVWVPSLDMCPIGSSWLSRLLCDQRPLAAMLSNESQNSLNTFGASEIVLGLISSNRSGYFVLIKYDEETY